MLFVPLGEITERKCKAASADMEAFKSSLAVLVPRTT
jgi:hypothetical protein